jgi:uncharacterized protein (TIGR03545 family)
MRKKFVYFALIPVVLVGILLYFFLDSWVEFGLEYAGEKIVGAKVEIDHLRLTINPIGMEFSRLQVTDPDDGWKNSFESGKVKFALNFGQLLRGKYIIETMEVNNLIFGTKRTTDGSLPKTQEPASATTTQVSNSSGSSNSSNSASFDLDKIKQELNVNDLLNPKNLAAYRQLDTVEQQIHNASAQWQTSLDEFDKSKGKLSDIETKVKAININDIIDVPAALDALNKVKSALNTANEIKTTFNERKITLTNGVNSFSGSFKNFDDLAKQDYRHVLSMAHLPDLSMKEIATLLLGKNIEQQAFKYLGYAEKAHTAMKNSSDTPAIETPARLKGQNIHFAIEHSYPKFWIKKILISGGTDKQQDPQYFYATGQVLNITNDQHITGIPLTIHLAGTKGGTTTLSLDASFDRRHELAVDIYKAQLTGLQVNEMRFGQSDLLPSKATGTVADAVIDVNVPGNQFEANTKIDFRNMKIVFDREPNSMMEHVVHDVLAPITGLDVKLRMWKNAEKFDMAFETNLDDQLASRTKQALGNELAKIQDDLRKKLDAVLAPKRAEAEKFYNDKRELVNAKLKEYESQVNDKLALVEGKKRELEDKVEGEKRKQTDSVKKKAEEALKGLFK